MLGGDINVLVRFLVRDDEAQFEDEPAIEEALFTWKDTTADFADCLIGTKKPTAWMPGHRDLRREGCEVAGICRCLMKVSAIGTAENGQKWTSESGPDSSSARC